ncbi:Swt1 family HEPN domain-containing protein [Undibacterium sp. Di26W]|uniref:Swt1 family HEPN domain-containing protein n=1 Tax=Undibacterium sp. Di26W TaxID=3413035 RepID=UPI003BF1387B
MMSDDLRRYLEEQERIRQLLNPLNDLKRIQSYINPHEDYIKKFEIEPTALDIIRDAEARQKLLSDIPVGLALSNEIQKIERQRQLVRGSVEELRQLGFIDSKTETQSAINNILEAQNSYNRLFRLPEISELSALAHAAMIKSGISQIVMGTEDNLKGILGTMQNPWMQIENNSASAIALSELVSIGKAIDSYSSFDNKLVTALRSEFGDWRDVSMPLSQNLLDPMFRSEFYSAQGFNSNLTNFTTPAFREGLIIGGLQPLEAIDDTDDEGGLMRTNKAHSILLRFEVALRRFIEAVMEAEFGSDWMKHQLPPNMLDGWKDKKQKATKAGHKEYMLIEYADFSDYKTIIEKKDNWNKVFMPIFGRPEDIRESFQRLFPVRIATMHARIITRDDELLLQVETKRVLKAIENRK